MFQQVRYAALLLILTLVLASAEELNYYPHLRPAYVNGWLRIKGNMAAKRLNKISRFGQRVMQRPSEQSNEAGANELGMNHKICPSEYDSQQETPGQGKAMVNTREANMQEFPQHFLFQPPFVPLPVEQQQPQPQKQPQEQPQLQPQEQPQLQLTQEQVQLLEQLKNYIGQQQAQQTETRARGIKARSSHLKADDDDDDDNDDYDEECAKATNTTKRIPTTTARTKPTTDKSIITPKTEGNKNKTTARTTKPPGSTKTTKPATTTATTKRLPCCTKAIKRHFIQTKAEPNVIHFSLSMEKDKKEPLLKKTDLQIDGIRTLLRYRQALASGRLTKRSETQERHGPRRRHLLDKQQLMLAELKLWPIVYKNRQ